VTLRAVLHIGPPKTGTTSIQGCLAAARAELRDRGFHFATAPGEINHLALAAYGAGAGFTGSVVRRAGGGGGDGASMGPRLAKAIGTEITALPEYVHTVIYSSEQLGSLLTEPADVARLRQLLNPWFQEFRVILYLRRQDEMAVSKYSTALRAGGEIDPSILPPRGREALSYRLSDIVDLWAGAFGEAALRPRLLERQALIGGDVVTDFLAAIGIEGMPVEARPPASNPALTAEAQEMVRRFNILAEMRGFTDRPRLAPHLRAPRFQGKPRLPTRAEAEEFFARFEPGNERLRARYFPGRDRLFTADFSRYPEAHDATAVIPQDAKVRDVTLDVLSLVVAALRRAATELAARARAAASNASAPAAPALHTGIADALRRADAALATWPGARRGQDPASTGHADAGNAPAPLTLDAALDVLLTAAEALRQTEIEVLAGDARDAMASGQREKARQRWTRVLHMAHRHAEALQAIARLDKPGAATKAAREVVIA